MKSKDPPDCSVKVQTSLDTIDVNFTMPSAELEIPKSQWIPLRNIPGQALGVPRLGDVSLGIQRDSNPNGICRDLLRIAHHNQNIPEHGSCASHGQQSCDK